MRELEFLIRFVNNLSQLEVAINCSFLVGGRLIEGELISARKYYYLLSQNVQKTGPFISNEEQSLVKALVNIFDNFAGLSINIENPRDTPSLADEDYEEIYLQKAIIRHSGGEIQNLGLFHLRPLAVQGFRLGSGVLR